MKFVSNLSDEKYKMLLIILLVREKRQNDDQIGILRIWEVESTNCEQGGSDWWWYLVYKTSYLLHRLGPNISKCPS